MTHITAAELAKRMMTDLDKKGINYEFITTYVSPKLDNLVDTPYFDEEDNTISFEFQGNKGMPFPEKIDFATDYVSIYLNPFNLIHSKFLEKYNTSEDNIMIEVRDNEIELHHCDLDPEPAKDELDAINTYLKKYTEKLLNS